MGDVAVYLPVIPGFFDLVFNATLQWQFDMTAKVAFLVPISQIVPLTQKGGNPKS